MALADDIEQYGRAVDAGNISRDDAAEALVKASSGGLTQVGAGHLLDNCQTACAEYKQTFTGAARTLDKIYGLDDIQP
ncbi:hypothetical protein MQE23_08435 [Streptomyces sp. HP-A2021]|uniref:hypothetical protein n=1 Tax=Streptomyces sp. HP-A2021 TaxID=2927875 RepID=UPI001FAFEA35|nr:hypothetical protein [Streptomyces sp. HP-A2021]UOB09078.1 hypothetical protein MQE23_08435 [Streptomyces sp. HP-A2021]